MGRVGWMEGVWSIWVQMKGHELRNGMNDMYGTIVYTYAAVLISTRKKERTIE